MKAKNWRWAVPLVLTVASLSLMPDRTALAQVTAGSIRGLVTDRSEAVLPDVEVEATNLATDLKFTTTSTAAGVYVLTGLPVGNYRVVIQHTGFKQYVQEPVVIATASTTTLNITLELGEVSEKVTVTASVAPLIQTDNAEVSTVVENRVVMDLPLQVSSA